MSPEDIEKCEEKYNKAKAVHGILRHVAQSTKTPLEELYQKVGWPLYRKFGHAFDAFKKSVVDPLVIEETWKENAEGLSGVCNICLKSRGLRQKGSFSSPSLQLKKSTKKIKSSA